MRHVHLLVLRDEKDETRPRTRGECEGGPRPCPWVSCKYNLYLDVGKDGSLKLASPGREPHEVPDDWSCALDVAERGGSSLEDIGNALNVGRERVRQIEETALEHVLRRARRTPLNDFDEGRGERQNDRVASADADIESLADSGIRASEVESPPCNKPISFFAEDDAADEPICDAVWALVMRHAPPQNRGR